MPDTPKRPNVETILEDANSGGYNVEVAIEIRALCHYVQHLETERDAEIERLRGVLRFIRDRSADDRVVDVCKLALGDSNDTGDT